MINTRQLVIDIMGINKHYAFLHSRGAFDERTAVRHDLSSHAMKHMRRSIAFTDDGRVFLTGTGRAVAAGAVIQIAIFLRNKKRNVRP